MDRGRLLEMVRGSVAEGEVTLASGAKSDFYVDGRLVTLSPEGSRGVGEIVHTAAGSVSATSGGGPGRGGAARRRGGPRPARPRRRSPGAR